MEFRNGEILSAVHLERAAVVNLGREMRALLRWSSQTLFARDTRRRGQVFAALRRIFRREAPAAHNPCSPSM